MSIEHEQLQFASFLGASLCYADHRMNILLDKKPKCPCKPQVAMELVMTVWFAQTGPLNIYNCCQRFPVVLGISWPHLNKKQFL